jgi:hypothetical protein
LKKRRNSKNSTRLRFWSRVKNGENKPVESEVKQNSIIGQDTDLLGNKRTLLALKTKQEVLQWYIELNEGGTPHTEEEINRVKELIKTA